MSYWLRDRSIVSDRLLNIFSVFYAVAISCALLLSRAEDLGVLSKSTLNWFFTFQALFGFLLLGVLSRNIGIYFVFVAITILAHAFANFYTPSLRLGFPVQDYLLTDRVSSNYSFDMTKLYLKNILFFVPGGLLIGMNWRNLKELTVRYIYGLFSLTFLLSFVVILVQGIWDIKFLASGSGTAVEVNRAAGLFEDSGASTVVVSSFVCAFIAICCFVRFHQRWIRLSVLSCSCAFLFIGAFTGGRIFFGAVFIGSGIILLLFLNLFRSSPVIRNKKFSVLLFITLIFGVLTFATLMFPPPALRESFRAIAKTNAAGWIDGLLEVARNIDTNRLYHMQALIYDFQDHWFFGSGLGSFHANYHAYWITKLHLVTHLHIDNPSSLYLVILASFGIAGVLWLMCIGIVLWCLTNQVFECAVNRNKFNSSDLALVFAFGAASALIVSFCIGVHLVFVSVGAVLGLVAIGVGVSWSRWNSLAIKRIVKILAWVAPLFLIVGALILALRAGPSPAFRYAETGSPQVPLSLQVPISTHGLRGTWLSNRGELIYSGDSIDLFVEMPPEYYPLSVNIEIFDRSGSKAWTGKDIVPIYSLPNPGREIVVNPPSDLQKECEGETSPLSFCYFRLTTDPEWRFQRQSIGAFVIEKPKK